MSYWTCLVTRGWYGTVNYLPAASGENGPLGREELQGLAQLPTGWWYGEAGVLPIRQLDVGHAGRHRYVAAFALH